MEFLTSNNREKSPRNNSGRGGVMIPTWLFSGLGTSIFMVFVYQLVVPTYFPELVPDGCNSQYMIEGRWEIINDAKMVIGSAEIKQERNNCDFFVSGEFFSPINDQVNVRFRSSVSQIRGNQIYFFYENNYEEKGICQGHFVDLSQQSTKIYFVYTDLIDKDYNKDPKGALTFIKKKNQDYENRFAAFRMFSL